MIKIKYDGEYPNLCSGHLIVTIDGVEWDFGIYSLSSGGSVTFDDKGEENVTEGKWEVSEWPKGFPEEQKQVVLDAINAQIEHGCCGGCV